MPNLYWKTTDDNGKRARKRPLTFHLFVGELEAEVVTLVPSSSGATYQIAFWLPRLSDPRHLTLEKALSVATAAADAWFEAALK